MAQTGYTPIQLYYSSTTTNVPLAANLSNGELAINITDGKLFYKDNAAAVQVIGWKTVPTSAGGTGLTSYTAGDTLYYATGTTLTKLAIGTAYQQLGVNAGGTAPAWQPSATSVLTAQGDLLYASGANTLARLAKDANATRYLSNTGTTNNPAWAQINLANGVTGTLPVANGGTNLTSFTANGVVYASSTSALATSSGLQYDGTNLYVGLTPSTWNFGKVIEIGHAGNAIFDVAASQLTITQNAYYNSAYKYGSTNFASRYDQGAGQHIWYVAPSGTAGNNITFSTAMTIDNSGNLTVPAIYTNTTAAVTYVAVSSAGLLQRGGVSALKYKQNIRDLENIDINKFRAVRYNSLCDNDDQTLDHFGFIADEVLQQGLKELITYGENGDVEGFQYERMCVVLLKNAQTQAELINTLTARITALENK
jgi:hypothetical protein